MKLRALILALSLAGAAGALAAEAPSAPPSPSSHSGRAPYLQPLKNGTRLDWLDGRVTVVGRARIFRDLGGNPVNYNITQAEAEREGYGRISEALAEVALDGSVALGTQPEVIQRFNAAMARRPAEAVVQDKGPMFQVRVSGLLWGAGGLITLVLPDRDAPKAENPATTASFRFPAGPFPVRASDVVHAAIRARSGAPATGLVIDARAISAAASLTPALLPRVLDTGGRIVYGVDAVDLDFAREYGMVAYQEGRRPDAPLPPPGREGNDPLQVTAVAAGGTLRGDIVIEPETADRILAAASAQPFLKECRVVVLMPPSPLPPAIVPPGTTRPLRPSQPPPPPGKQ